MKSADYLFFGEVANCDEMVVCGEVKVILVVINTFDLMRVNAVLMR